MEDKYTIGGRDFVSVGESTLEHDLEISALIKEAGISELTLGAGETSTQFAQRLAAQLMASRQTTLLLGCLIVPAPPDGQAAGDTWTPALMRETAAFLAKVKAPAEKAKIQSIVLTMVIHFFQSGIVSLWSSPTSSEAHPGKGTRTRPPGVKHVASATGRA